MAHFGKQNLSEMKIAGQYVVKVAEKVRQVWPKISNDLKKIFPRECFDFESEDAMLDFMLAVIANDLPALPNLLPQDQAKRIHEYVIKCVSSKELGSYPREVLEAYQKEWNRSIKEGIPPFYGIANQLYEQLKIENKMKHHDAEFKVPLKMMVLVEAINSIDYPWKNVIEEYNIVP
jgi:hypothetical protein